jgi:streptolysin S family bacteriocin protoxin
MATINDIIERAKEDVKRIIEQAQAGNLEAQPGRTMMESFENRVNQVRAGAGCCCCYTCVRMLAAGAGARGASSRLPVPRSTALPTARRVCKRKRTWLAAGAAAALAAAAAAAAGSPSPPLPLLRPPPAGAEQGA